MSRGKLVKCEEGGRAFKCELCVKKDEKANE